MIQRPTDTYKFPLTPMQQGMLFETIKASRTGIYLQQLVSDLREVLDLARFKLSIAKLAQKHPAFRTSFRWEGLEEPEQVVGPQPDLELNIFDLGHLTLHEQESSFKAYLDKDRRRGIDLVKGPLTRFAIFKFAQSHYRILWTFHHALLDGRSHLLLIKELFRVYDSDGAQLAADKIPSAGATFRDHVYWIRSRDPRPSETFWRKHLAGFNKPTPLPGDRETSETRPDPLAVEEHLLVSATLTKRAEDLAKTLDVSLNNIIQGAWSLLLSRFSGELDVVFGGTRACRHTPLPESQSIVGLLINTVPVRVQIKEDEPLECLLRQIQATWKELRDYEHDSLRAIQTYSEIPAGTPLFESVLIFERFRVVDGNFPGNEPGEPRRSFDLHEVSNIPMALAAYGGERLTIKLEYDSTRFSACLAQRILRSLEALVEQMVAEPTELVSRFSVLTTAERKQILHDWSGAAVKVPFIKPVHVQIEEHASTNGEKVALELEGKRLTYAELNQRADQIAGALKGLGISSNSLVGLCLERSIEMVVGMIGILKAGGAYVPLDPGYPKERLSFIFQDTASSVILTSKGFESNFPPGDYKTVYVEISGADSGHLGEGRNRNPEPQYPSTNLAYVIYTSGSTGQPKGVMIDHSALTNYVGGASAYYDIRPDDRVLQFASMNFDASVEEIFCTLCQGSTLVLRNEEMISSIEIFIRKCVEWEITVISLPTAFWHELVNQVSAGTVSLPPTVRLIIIGGERVQRERVKDWLVHVGNRPRLVNSYGPTETTVVATVWEVTKDAFLEETKEVPIGRVLPNLRSYVLDRSLRPVPMGVAGELHIGGSGLARGYLNQPELTNLKFIADPFQPGDRLYKTGDLVSYLPDGNLEYRGRADDQVKIRGFRVELGEIEHALSQHPEVQECAVIVKSHKGSAQRLAAFCVAKPQTTLNAASLRNFLRGTLPSYMIPAGFAILPEFPITPNGKIDRKALASQEVEEAESDSSDGIPRNRIEKTLADIWADRLRLKRVGIHDNFFELGGDSILSIQIISKAAQSGIRFTPKQFFQHQTIAELATCVAGSLTLVPDRDETLKFGPAELTPIQRWFFEQNFQHPEHWNMGMVIEIPPNFNPAVGAKAINELARRHDVFHLQFRGSASEPRAEYVADDPLVTIEHHDLGILKDEERDKSIQQLSSELHQKLNLAKGALMGAAIFTLGAASTGRICLAIHHLVVDGVSWRILLEELEAIYSQLERGQDVTLPPRSTSFRTWGKRLVDYASNTHVGAELEYWKKQLSDAPVKIPTDFDEQTACNDEGSAGHFSIGLNSKETTALLREVPSVYRTQVNDLLLTALVMGFEKWTGSRSLAIELEGHGREDVIEGLDLSRTVGWFTTVFPVLLKLPSSGNTGAAIKAVKETLRNIPSRGFNFTILRYLHPKKEVRRQIESLPQPKVLFNYLGQFESAEGDSSIMKFMNEPPGIPRAPGAKRGHLIEIDAMVIGGELTLHWTYSRSVHREHTVKLFSEGFISALKALISHCQESPEGGLTPSDVPLSKLGQSELDALGLRADRVEDIYPLVPLQSLFLAVRDPGFDTGFDQWCYRLVGDVDFSALRSAWQEVIRRHAVLRTRFLLTGVPVPMQVVERHATLPWEEMDWTHEANPDEKLGDFLQANQKKGFDLSTAPLMRFQLIRLNPRTHFLIWSHHHLILDGWSWPVLFKEVATIYAAQKAGTTAELARVRHFRDYVDWIQKQNLEMAETYWRRVLSGYDNPIQLISETATSSAAVQQVETTQIELNRADTEALRKLARAQKLTLNVFVQAAWALWLSSLSRQNDVVFGLAVSGRPAELTGVENMVGLFINNLPTRVRIPESQDLVSWLQELQTEQYERGPFETTSLLRVQEWSNLSFQHRLFESILVYQNYTVDESSERWLGPNVNIENVRIEVKTNYPVTVMAYPGDSLKLVVYSRPGVFSPSNLELMRQTLSLVLKRMAQSDIPTASLLDGVSLPQIETIRSNQKNARSRKLGKELVAPTDPLEQRLEALWERIFGASPISVDDNFFELGGHSLLAVKLFSEIERLTGKNLPLVTLFEAPTIRQLAGILGQKGWKPTWSALVPIKRSGSRPPFYCVHGVGGNILEFLDLANYMEPEQPFYGIQAVGLDGKRPPLESIEEMAANHIQEIRALQPRGPYHLGGSSFGGYVAYEIAQQLLASGEKVALLAFFDTHGPGYPKLLPQTSRLKQKWNRFQDRVALHWGDFKITKREGKWDYVKIKFKRWKKSFIRELRSKFSANASQLRKHASKEELPEAIRTVGEASHRASDLYVCKQYPGDATLFRATEQPRGIYQDRTLGWSAYIQGELRVYDTPGHHGAMVREPRAGVLAEQLKHSLRIAQQKIAPSEHKPT